MPILRRLVSRKELSGHRSGACYSSQNLLRPNEHAPLQAQCGYLQVPQPYLDFLTPDKTSVVSQFLSHLPSVLLPVAPLMFSAAQHCLKLPAVVEVWISVIRATYWSSKCCHLVCHAIRGERIVLRVSNPHRTSDMRRQT